MVDNLFVVESPLQALNALELSLQFKDEKNGIVYRVVEGREKNNNQMTEVIGKGVWTFKKEIIFDSSSTLLNHKSVALELKKLSKRFPKGIKKLFIGEFRSQWMHFMRCAVSPSRTVLMDDGAATLIVKQKFIDNGIYYPAALWKNKNIIKELAKRYIYSDFLKRSELESPLHFASAFNKEGALYPIDFSSLIEMFKKNFEKIERKSVFFFGSKYSESGIISRDYEVFFLKGVKQFYSKYKCDLVYCAHRDESQEKLEIIRNELKLNVFTGSKPAEIFLLENHCKIHEIAGAYSSVLNNAKVLFPEASIRGFRLDPKEISYKYKEDIELVYKHLEKKGVVIS